MAVSRFLFKPSTVLFGALSQVFQPIQDMILNAVPKMKVTRYRIRRRLTTQYLKPIQNIHICKVCGSETMVNHLCVVCLEAVVVKKITEIGDELKGKPSVRKEWLTQRIKKARGLNNTLAYFENRNGKQKRPDSKP